MLHSDRLEAAELRADFTWLSETPGCEDRAIAREAAVMMLLSEDPDPAVLFTRRARGIKQGGQVSFPGGARDRGETPNQTALRETFEEVGLPPSEIAIIGHVPSRKFTRLKVDVVPVVGRWHGDMSALRVSEAEVCEAFSVPVTQLVAPENRCTWILGDVARGPGFVIDGRFIWGMTAAITDAVLRIMDFEQEWDAGRKLAVPPEFQ